MLPYLGGVNKVVKSQVERLRLKAVIFDGHSANNWRQDDQEIVCTSTVENLKTLFKAH